MKVVGSILTASTIYEHQSKSLDRKVIKLMEASHMKYYVDCLKRLGWRAGLWFDTFTKRYVWGSDAEPRAEDLSSQEYYY